MSRQKKILDINEGGSHIVCIQQRERGVINPYRIYVIISPTGAPVQRRLLTKYADFMSVLYFLRDFYLNGLNTMPVSEAVEWINAHTA